jgi:hypothetical protein
MALGAVLAAAGNAGAAFAGGLLVLMASQALTGAGWALVYCSAFGAALAAGQGGRQGLMAGALNAVLAAAAFARIAIVSQGMPTGPTVLGLAWLAAVGFVLCSLLIGLRRAP